MLALRGCQLESKSGVEVQTKFICRGQPRLYDMGLGMFCMQSRVATATLSRHSSAVLHLETWGLTEARISQATTSAIPSTEIRNRNTLYRCLRGKEHDSCFYFQAQVAE